MHICIYIYIHIYICKNICVIAYIYICIIIYIYAYILSIYFLHIYIYTHAYTYVELSMQGLISHVYIYTHLFNHGYFLQSRRWCSFHLCPGHYTFNLCLGVVMDLGVIQKAGIDGVWSLNANRSFHSAEVFSHAKWHWGGKNRLDKYTVYFCLYKYACTAQEFV